jgi:hypothetical protein
MEYTQIINLITSLGLPTAMVVVLWLKQNKSDEEHKKNLVIKDEQNRKDTQALIDRQDIVIAKQDKRLDGMEINAKEDRKTFQSAIDSFNKSVQSFQAVNGNVTNIENKLNTIEQDITIIKTKMDK